MSYILRRQRWLQKPPPNATAIDWNHPLAQGLAVAILFNENGAAPRDYVRMLPGTVAAGAPVAQLGGTKLSSGNDCWSWDGTVIPDSAFTGDITLIQRVNVLSGGTYRHFAGKHASGGGAFNPFDWRTTSDGSTQALIRASAGGFAEIDSATSTVSFGIEKQYAVACIANMTAASFYTDRAVSQNSVGAQTCTGSNAALRIGQRADGATVAQDGIVQYFYGYSRVLHDGEVFALLEAPYQFLRPHLRRVYSLPAAASTVVGASRQRPWRTQPRVPAALDLSHPLMRDAVLVMSGHQLSQDLLGQPWTNTRNPEGSTAGLAARVSKTAYINRPLATPPAGGWTIAAYLAPAVALSGGKYIGWCASPGNSTYDRQIYANGPWGAYIFDGTQRSLLSTAPSPAIGRFDVVVASATSVGPTLNISVNGSPYDSLGVTNTGFTGYTNPDFAIGNSNDSFSVGDELLVALLVVANRPWSEVEAKAFAQNPWQIFSPQRRRVSSFVAGGGTSSFSYTAVGGIVFAGAAAVLRARVLAAVGGLVFAGTAAMARAAARLASGGIVFGGSSTSSRNSVYQAVGGLVFSGAAAAARVASRVAAGGIVFAGAAAVTFHSGIRTVVAAGGIVFGGNATVSYVGQRMSEWFLRNRRRRRH